MDETLPPHNKKLRYYESMEKEKVSWETLKNRKLILPSGTYSNPYDRRIDHGSVNRAAVSFNQEYRNLGK